MKVFHDPKEMCNNAQILIFLISWQQLKMLQNEKNTLKKLNTLILISKKLKLKLCNLFYAL